MITGTSLPYDLFLKVICQGQVKYSPGNIFVKPACIERDIVVTMTVWWMRMGASE